MMAEWDELGRSKRGVAAAGRVVETLQRGCGLDRKSQHGRWRRNEEGEGYQRDIFIGPEFYFTETKNKKDSQGQTGVCRGKGGSKTKVIGADVILDTKWRTLRNVDIFSFSCHFAHTERLIKCVYVGLFATERIFISDMERSLLKF